MPEAQPPSPKTPAERTKPRSTARAGGLRPDQEKTQMAVQWLSRTMSIMLFMVGPALLGRYLDQRFGTQFLTVSGLILGMVLATGLLLLLVQKLTPPAGGSPLPFDNEQLDESEQEKSD